MRNSYHSRRTTPMTEQGVAAMDTCPNCGATRTGVFCSACGQNSREYQRPVQELAGELVTEQFDLDSRLIRTAKGLIFNPGYLTREFVRGRRASYVSPVRLYLIVSVAFFTTLSLSTDLDLVDFGGPNKQAVSVEQDPAFLELFKESSPEQRVRARAILERSGRWTPEIQQQLDAIEKTPAAPQTSSIETRVRDRLLDLIERPRSVNELVVNHLPFALFVALPVYAVFLKLLYPRRYYAEHLVFALHLHSFLFMLGIALLLIPETRAGEFAVAVLQFLGAVYYFVALHRVQGQSWARSAMKFIAINLLHIVLIVATVVFTAFIVLIW